MKIHALSLSILLALSFGISSDVFAQNCIKGKPCGNSCISKADVCHIDVGPATNETNPEVMERTTIPAQSAAIPAPKAKHCKKGKPCGNSCISEKAKCSLN